MQTASVCPRAIICNLFGLSYRIANSKLAAETS